MRTAASTTPLSDEARTFLQHRVALFGLAGTAVGLLGFILRPLLVWAVGQTDLIIHPVALFHAAAFASLTVAWLLLRRGQRSHRYIVGVEYAALFACAAGFVGMGSFIPQEASPETIVPMGLGMILVLRAIFVPSLPRRTLTIALLIAPLPIGTIFALYARVDPPNVELDLGTGMQDAYVKAGMSAVWWTMITLISTMASKVIYGLRAEIRDIQKLGQYTLERKLGEGGMGAVYQASHAMLRRPAAVKLLPPRKIGALSLARFEREVQLTARLTHFNTVTVFDYGRSPDGVFYYVMELIEGLSLKEVIEIDGPQPPGRVVHLLAQAAGALAEAHDIGLIHRDIKPANMMLCIRGGEPDVVKVVDFGLVKEIGGDISASLTNAEMVQGTPQYISPEAITSPDEVGPAADLYGLGCVGYYLLTGDHVFSGNAVEVCSHHLHTQPEPLSSRAKQDVPVALDALIMACLSKRPEDRPESARALRAALQQLDGLAPWTEEDANSWWQRLGPTIQRKHTRSSTGVAATLAIDLHVRA